MQTRLILCLIVSAAQFGAQAAATFSNTNWVSFGGLPGANGQVYAAVVDGAGNLYIGGNFTEVGNVVASNIARWDGASWSAVGLGVNGSVQALAVSGSNVYAGGGFSAAGGVAATNIAKWDGRAWTTLGSGVGGEVPYPTVGVNALAVLGNDVYAGGNFTTAGGNPANYIAKWNGSTWSALGSGMAGGNQYSSLGVSTLAALGGNIYAGGNFTMAGGTNANYIAQWDGASWNALGSGMDSPVSSLAVSGSDLYAGGGFANAGSVVSSNIAKWNGTTWSALGSGVGNYVSALAVLGSEVYAGWFTNPICAAGGCAGGGGGIVKWNGSGWSSLGASLGVDLAARVYTLAPSGSNLFAGGNFTVMGGSLASYIANWNGSVWSSLGPGLGGGNSAYAIPPAAVVNALALSGTNLYAGGVFITVGDTATNIAKWDGSGWRALGSGLGGWSAYPAIAVSALAVSGTNLYVAGGFSTAGGAPATNIAKWDGSAWSPLGSGLNYPVYALAASGSDLYAGGDFNMAGGGPANYVAKWNGSTWSPLGSGVNSTVYALAVSGSNVYAGGQFTTAGGSPANQIAKWDGNSWSPLGTGMDYRVIALAASGSNLYAGGYFDNAGGSPANYIAKWNGSAWSALGSGVDYYVSALAVVGSDVYAGGNIGTAGGSPANGIAKWDGSSWSTLGSGVNGPVNALARSGNDLYVGGAFTLAGGKVSAYVAKAIIGPPPFYIVSGNGNLGFSNKQFYFTLIGPAGSNAVIFASTNLQTWTPLATNPLTGGSLTFSDSSASNYTRRYYRALLQP